MRIVSWSRSLRLSGVDLLCDMPAWDGEVETFDLNGHPKAKRCHAWGYVDAGQFKVTAVLELLLVDSLSTAVDAAIAAEAKR
jgi:hypothetical protein